MMTRSEVCDRINAMGPYRAWARDWSMGKTLAITRSDSKVDVGDSLLVYPCIAYLLPINTWEDADVWRVNAGTVDKIFDDLDDAIWWICRCLDAGGEQRIRLL